MKKYANHAVSCGELALGKTKLQAFSDLPTNLNIPSLLLSSNPTYVYKPLVSLTSPLIPEINNCFPGLTHSEKDRVADKVVAGNMLALTPSQGLDN